MRDEQILRCVSLIRKHGPDGFVLYLYRRLGDTQSDVTDHIPTWAHRSEFYKAGRIGPWITIAELVEDLQAAEQQQSRDLARFRDGCFMEAAAA